MKDSDFKSLAHCVGNNQIASRGSEVSKGYKPDLIIKSLNDEVVFIIESEQKTDRKAFIGSFIKAEKYAEECRAHPVLVIVMQQFENTTVQQIADHLAPYAAWIAKLKGGSLHLSKILIISDVEYQLSVRAIEVLGSQQFCERATLVSFT